MVARDRIELPTRGFSVPMALFCDREINNLTATIYDRCITVPDLASLIHAKFTQSIYPSLPV